MHIDVRLVHIHLSSPYPRKKHAAGVEVKKSWTPDLTALLQDLKRPLPMLLRLGIFEVSRVSSSANVYECVCVCVCVSVCLSSCLPVCLSVNSQ